MTTLDHDSCILPAASPDQQYVTVSTLVGGYLTLSDHFFVHPAEEGAKRTVPSLSFLISHPGPRKAPFGQADKPYRLIFDLGLRRSKERYAASLQKHIDGRAPFKLEPGVAHYLREGGLDPKDVDSVLLSHVHYDHHGDPEDFPNSTFIVGHGALDVLQNGLAGKGSHQHFDANLFSQNKSFELPSPSSPSQNNQGMEWVSIGPFPALDFLGDGSVYILDVPGHLPGHINLLCRISESKWVCLCGDAFHDRRLLTGEKEIGTWEGEAGQTFCIHVDKAGAKESIRRLRILQQAKGGEVELIAAHDEEWLERNQQALFPGTIG